MADSNVSPTEMKLTLAEGGCSAVNLAAQSPDSNQKSDNTIRLKPKLGLIDGVGIIMGVIIGSGIFVSPKGVLQYSGSVGLATVIWILSGLLSTIGALCYAELGTMIPKSGGDYAYILEAFGPLPAFLFMWSALLIIIPTGNAIIALTFAKYILQPVYPGCEPPILSVQLIAAALTCGLTAINCYDVKWVTKLQDVFTLTKVLALIMIICTGIWWLVGEGHYENLQQPMEGSNWEAGYVALAFYSGIFSFAGWNYLNFVTEEIKSPYKNLPRAICISLPLVIVIYVLVNCAYFVVLSKAEMLASDAVAVTFGKKTFGYLSWIISIFVACATFGSLNGNIFTSSRLFFVGAQNGHLPKAIALISVKRLTPIPSLIFLGLVTVMLSFVEDVNSLINYTTFVESLFTLVSVSGLLWLRIKQPHLKRPIKVHIVFPIIFFVICSFVVILPCYVKPWEVAIGFIVILSGIPVFVFLIQGKRKPECISDLSNALNTFCGKLFLSTLSDEYPNN